MKISHVVASAVITMGLLGGSVAFADDANHNGKPQDGYGPVMEMMMMGHKMHMQAIEAGDGGQWVVLSRAEAEMLLGSSMDKTAFTKLK